MSLGDVSGNPELSSRHVLSFGTLVLAHADIHRAAENSGRPHYEAGGRSGGAELDDNGNVRTDEEDMLCNENRLNYSSMDKDSPVETQWSDIAVMPLRAMLSESATQIALPSSMTAIGCTLVGRSVPLSALVSPPSLSDSAGVAGDGGQVTPEGQGAVIVRSKTFPRVNERPPLVGGSRSSSMPPIDVNASGSSQSASAVPAWRGVNVLVSFCDDSHKHVERVVRLGKCLQRNGFHVTVDMPQQCFPRPVDAEHFLRRRYEASDFVLICVSPKYKLEIESLHGTGGNFHSKFVFELITGSWQNSSRKLVCIFLPDMNETHVPVWLHSLSPLRYQWPQEYKDVLFYVSKPQRLFEMQQAFPDLRKTLSDACELDSSLAS